MKAQNDRRDGLILQPFEAYKCFGGRDEKQRGFFIPCHQYHVVPWSHYKTLIETFHRDFSQHPADEAVSSWHFQPVLMPVCKGVHFTEKVRGHQVQNNVCCFWSQGKQIILLHKCMGVDPQLCHLVDERGIAGDNCGTEICYTTQYMTSMEFNSFLSGLVTFHLHNLALAQSCWDLAESWITWVLRPHIHIF